MNKGIRRRNQKKTDGAPIDSERLEESNQRSQPAEQALNEPVQKAKMTNNFLEPSSPEHPKVPEPVQPQSPCVPSAEPAQKVQNESNPIQPSSSYTPNEPQPGAVVGNIPISNIPPQINAQPKNMPNLLAPQPSDGLQSNPSNASKPPIIIPSNSNPSNPPNSGNPVPSNSPFPTNRPGNAPENPLKPPAPDFGLDRYRMPENQAIPSNTPASQSPLVVKDLVSPRVGIEHLPNELSFPEISREFVHCRSVSKKNSEFVALAVSLIETIHCDAKVGEKFIAMIRRNQICEYNESYILEQCTQRAHDLNALINHENVLGTIVNWLKRRIENLLWEKQRKDPTFGAQFQDIIEMIKNPFRLGLDKYVLYFLVNFIYFRVVLYTFVNGAIKKEEIFPLRNPGLCPVVDLLYDQSSNAVYVLYSREKCAKDGFDLNSSTYSPQQQRVEETKENSGCEEYMRRSQQGVGLYDQFASYLIELSTRLENVSIKKKVFKNYRKKFSELSELLRQHEFVSETFNLQKLKCKELLESKDIEKNAVKMCSGTNCSNRAITYVQCKHWYCTNCLKTIYKSNRHFCPLDNTPIDYAQLGVKEANQQFTAMIQKRENKFECVKCKKSKPKEEICFQCFTCRENTCKTCVYSEILGELFPDDPSITIKCKCGADHTLDLGRINERCSNDQCGKILNITYFSGLRCAGDFSDALHCETCTYSYIKAGMCMNHNVPITAKPTNKLAGRYIINCINCNCFKEMPYEFLPYIQCDHSFCLACWTASQNRCPTCFAM